MALDIGFGTEVDAVFVAEFIPIGVVGIMAGAHGIDVHLLHLLDVLEHALTADDVTSIGVHFVAIDAFDEDWFAVDQKLSIA